MAEPPELEVSCQAVKQQLDADADLLLLDCREPDEHATAAVSAARLLPMGELPGRVEELREWQDRPLVVMCHHGMRSAQVAMWLRGQGFTQAQSMAGGIDRWSLEIDPETPRY
ncbi:MAG: rhodanese-like domain-containing protein [Planctomycetota bacterium]